MKSPVHALTKAYIDQGTPKKPARALAEFTINTMDKARRFGTYVLTREDRDRLILLQELAWGEAHESVKTAKMIECVYSGGGVTWVEHQ